MFNVGGGEVLVILLLALIVLGPDKLPDFARKVGRAMHEVRRLSSGFQNEVRQAMELDEEPASRRVAPRLVDPPAPEPSPSAATTAAGAGDPAGGEALGGSAPATSDRDDAEGRPAPGDPSAA